MTVFKPFLLLRDCVLPSKYNLYLESPKREQNQARIV